MENVKEKKSIFKKWWFWLIIALIVVIIISSSSGSETPTNEGGNQPSAEQSSSTTETQKPAETVSYEKVELQTMLNELKSNALKAEKTYKDKNVELVGKISNFDSDGKYISIEPVNADEWNFDRVQCYIKDDAQLDFLLEKEVGDSITVKGKIKSIGEVLGYSLNIDEVF